MRLAGLSQAKMAKATGHRPADVKRNLALAKSETSAVAGGPIPLRQRPGPPGRGQGRCGRRSAVRVAGGGVALGPDHGLGMDRLGDARSHRVDLNADWIQVHSGGGGGQERARPDARFEDSVTDTVPLWVLLLVTCSAT
jgi:hypothetical protein